MNKRVFPALAVALVAFVPYLNSLRGQFVWDDAIMIVESPFLRSWGSVASLVYKPSMGAIYTGLGFYRPLVFFTFFVDHKLWGLNPLGFHLTNLILHTLCSVLVYFLCCKVLKGRAVPLMSGLLFALHPIHTEAVSWISGRTDILAALFFLLSIILYLRAEQADRRASLGYQASAVIVFALSLAAKEMAMTLPLVLGLYHVCFSPLRGRKRLLTIGLRLLPFLCVLGLYTLVRRVIFGPAAFGLDIYTRSLGEIISGTSGLLLFYLKLLLLPVGLANRHSISDVLAVSPSQSDLYIPALLMILLLCSLLRRVSKGAFFGSWWIFLCLLPVSNIAPIDRIAEGFLYLPSVGICIIIPLMVIGARDLPGKVSSSRTFKNGSLIAFLSILVLFSLITVPRNRQWHDDLSLWSSAVKRYPHKQELRLRVIYTQIIVGRYEEAVTSYRELLKEQGVVSDAAQAQAFNAAGLEHVSREGYDLAAAVFRMACSLQPEEPEYRLNLGNAYREAGRYDLAIEQYEKAIALDPDHEAAREGIRTVREKAGP